MGDDNSDISGGLSGAAAGGSVAGPYGAAIGAALGILKSQEDEKRFQRQQIANAEAIRMSPWMKLDARQHNFKPSDPISDVAALGGAGFQQGLKLDAAKDPHTQKTLALGDGGTPQPTPATGFGLGANTQMPDASALWNLLAQAKGQ